MKEKIKEVLNTMIVNYNLLEDSENVIDDMEYLYNTHADDIVEILKLNVVGVTLPTINKKLTELEIKQRDCEHIWKWDKVSPPWEKDDKCTECGKMNYSDY